MELPFSCDVEILDITLSPPVLHQVQRTTPLSITPISELRKNNWRLGSLEKFFPLERNSSVTPSLLFPMDVCRNCNCGPHLTRRYDKASIRTKQTKITDFIKKQKLFPSGLQQMQEASMEMQANFPIDLPDTSLSKDLLLDSSHINSFLSVDFGKLRKEDFLPSPAAIPENSGENNISNGLWKAQDEHQLREINIAKNLHHDAYAFPDNPAPAMDKGKSLSSDVILEIRDLVKEIKELLIVSTGLLKERAQLQPEELLAQRMKESPLSCSDKD